MSIFAFEVTRCALGVICGLLLLLHATRLKGASSASDTQISRLSLLLRRYLNRGPICHADGVEHLSVRGMLDLTNPWRVVSIVDDDHAVLRLVHRDDIACHVVVVVVAVQ